MEIKTFVFNPFQQNTFIISEGNEAVMIDAGCHNDFENNQIKEYLTEKNLTLTKLLITHCHFDHILGVQYIKNEFPEVEIYASTEFKLLYEKLDSMSAVFGVKCDKQPEPTNLLKDGDTIKIFGKEVTSIHVPGHSPCSIVYHFEDQKAIFSGDVLFNQSIGRTDFPYGDFDQLNSGIKEKLFTLNENTTVYCGHGPSTSIAFEKQNNAFLI